jgi:hypothetical protein
MRVDFTEVKVEALIHVKFAVVNMDAYETDEILSQALDLVEDVENDIIFITQSTKMKVLKYYISTWDV